MSKGRPGVQERKTNEEDSNIRVNRLDRNADTGDRQERGWLTGGGAGGGHECRPDGKAGAGV